MRDAVSSRTSFRQRAEGGVRCGDVVVVEDGEGVAEVDQDGGVEVEAGLKVLGSEQAGLLVVAARVER
jgi:hypothetical protein